MGDFNFNQFLILRRIYFHNSIDVNKNIRLFFFRPIRVCEHFSCNLVLGN